MVKRYFGAPKPLSCFKTKLTDIDADIDDIYHCLLQYPDEVLADATIEVISRPVASPEATYNEQRGTDRVWF